MQIQALSASAPNFTASYDIMPIPDGAEVRFDAGHPFLIYPKGSIERTPKEDTFERKAALEEQEDDFEETYKSEPKSMSEAIAQRKPGYRPEDFLY